MTNYSLLFVVVSCFFVLWINHEDLNPKFKADQLTIETNNSAPKNTSKSSSITQSILCEDEGFANLGFFDILPQNGLKTSSGTLTNLTWPRYDNFEVDYFVNESVQDSLHISGIRVNRRDGVLLGPTDFTTSYNSFGYDSSNDIPGIRLESNPGDEVSLNFQFSDNPDWFDFIVWDIDNTDMCWFNFYDENGTQILITDQYSDGHLATEHPAPVATWNETLQILSSPESGNPSYRNYFVFHFENQPISSIEVTITGDEPQDCDISDSTSLFCPHYYFSLYATVPTDGCIEVAHTTCGEANGSATYIPSSPNVDYDITWEAGNTNLAPGTYMATVTENSGSCSNTEIMSFTIGFEEQPVADWISVNELPESQFALSGKKLKNGEYILAGVNVDSDNLDGGQVAQFAEDGVVNWNNTYKKDLNRDDVIYDIVETNNGYLMVGYSKIIQSTNSSCVGSANSGGWLIQTDVNGEFQTDEIYERGCYLRLYSIDPIDEETFVLGGSTANDSTDELDLWVAKIDSDRIVIDEKTIPLPECNLMEQVLPTKDGGFVVVSSSRVSDNASNCSVNSSTFNGGYILKLSFNLETEWEYEWTATNGILYDVVESKVGGFLVTGTVENGPNNQDIVLLNLNGQGQLIDTILLGEEEIDEGYNNVAIEVLDDGNILLLGNTSIADGRDFVCYKIDLNGNILWEKVFGFDKRERATAIFQGNNGNIIIGGYSNSDDINTNDYDFMIMELVTPLPQVFLGNDTTVCAADYTITAQDTLCNPCLYEWSTGDTTSTLTVTATNNYQLTITDQNGCTARDSIHIEFCNYSCDIPPLLCEEIHPFVGKSYDVWHIGDGGGLDFSQMPNGGFPQSFSDSNIPSALTQDKEASTFCDPVTGEVLLYSNTWNMWSGDGDLFTGPGLNNTINPDTVLASARADGQIIVAPPGQCGNIETLYLFFADDSVRYVIVDLPNKTFSEVNTLNSFLVSAQLNVVQTSCDSIWMVYRARTQNHPELRVGDLHAILWTPDSMYLPVVTPNLHKDGIWVVASNFSLDGAKYAASYRENRIDEDIDDNDKILVCDFNQQTGEFCNPIYLNPRVGFDEIPMDTTFNYGIAFSPDKTKLFTNVYKSATGDPENVLVQFNLSLDNVEDIQSDYRAIDVNTELVVGGLINGPDGRIYGSPRREGPNNIDSDRIGIITDPNSIDFEVVPFELNLSSGGTSTKFQNIIFGKGPAACLPVLDSIAGGEECGEFVIHLAPCYLGAGGPYTLQVTDSETENLIVSITDLLDDDNNQEIQIQEDALSMTGTYDFQLFDQLNCGGLFLSDIIIDQQRDTMLRRDTLCQGDTLIYNGVTYTGAIDTILNTNDCASEHLMITELTLASDTIFIKDCLTPPNCIIYSGVLVCVDTIFTIKYVNKPCDSLVIAIDIEYNEVMEIDTSICAGDSIFLIGAFQTMAGIYRDTIERNNDCDSMVIIDLMVDALIEMDTMVVLCAGDVFELCGEQFDSTGNYEVRCSGIGEDCDTIYQLDLMVDALIEMDTMVVLCAGDVFELCDSTFETTGTYEVTCSGMGCDTIYQLSLEVKVPESILVDTFLCEGDCIILEGEEYCDPTIVEIFPLEDCANDTTWNIHFWNTDSLILNDDLYLIGDGDLPLEESLLENDSLPAIRNWMFEVLDILPELTSDDDGSFTYDEPASATFNYSICMEACPTVCAQAEVTITYGTEPIIPDLITPNGDGENDIFEFKNIDEFENIDVTIFNQWGDIVFRSEAYELENNWDGGNLPVATYYYSIIFDLGKGIVREGSVVILR